jgi:hypothetical protein
MRADEASPSSQSDDDSTGSDSSDSESPPLSTSPESPYQIPRRPAMMMQVDSPPWGGGDGFEVSDCGNFDPMDSDREYALKPYAIEYAESDRSRSRSRCAREHRRSIDPQLVEKMHKVNCDDDSGSEDEYAIDDEDFRNFIRQQKEIKWRNRMSHGSSIGKRTISERGSDSEREDLASADGRDGHLGDRRTRRRVERRSGLFADAQPERIPELPELEEPDTDDEVDLARELPFCDTDLEIMEVDDETETDDE